MSEPKLFNQDNDFDKKARKLLTPLSKEMFNASTQFSIDCQDCYKFADIIIEKGLILFTDVIPHNLYREILSKVLSQYNYIGTYGAYYFLLKLFYGSNAIIEFLKVRPAHLQIKVSNIEVRTYEWVDSNNYNIIEPMAEDDEEETNILFADRILDLTEENLKKLIDNIKPVGFIVDIDIVS